MPLPQITTPEFTTTLPSTGEKIVFRPFLVKEEKILLMAQEGKDKQEIQTAILNILEECIKTPLTVHDLPLFDIEWLFLQLRAKSVGEVIDLKIKHIENKECNYPNPVEVNLEEMSEVFNIMCDCVLNVFDKDQVYNDFTPTELDKFIGDLDQKQLTKFMNFFQTMPKLQHTIKYKCEKCGEEVEHELNGLLDFFSLV